MLEPVEHEHVESTVVCEEGGGRNGNRQEWKGLMDRARAGCWSWPSGEAPESDDSSRPRVEERRSFASNQKACCRGRTTHECQSQKNEGVPHASGGMGVAWRGRYMCRTARRDSRFELPGGVRTRHWIVSGVP